MISVKKPEWMTVAVWKGLRTAFQTFLGVVALAFISVAQAYAQGGSFDWDYLWRSGIVMGVAAVAGWWMNRNPAGGAE